MIFRFITLPTHRNFTILPVGLKYTQEVTGVNETEKREFQEELLKLREKIVRALARRVGEIPQEVLDEADLGNTTLSMELEVSSRKQLAETLEMVEKALRRIAAGTYDTCEICRRKIPLERLRAIPYTSLCVECQERQEKAKK